jgi:hypothetical protein
MLVSSPFPIRVNDNIGRQSPSYVDRIRAGMLFLNPTQPLVSLALFFQQASLGDKFVLNYMLMRHLLTDRSCITLCLCLVGYR